MEWLSPHRCCRVWRVLYGFCSLWLVGWLERGMSNFTLVLFLWAPVSLGLEFLFHDVWPWSRMYCVTLLLLCEVLLFLLGEECDVDGFCFRIDWENRRGKTLSCSKKRMLSISPANTIFSDWCFSRLFLTTSSERDVLASCAEIEIYIGCFRASVLSVFWWWWWWCEFEFGHFGGVTCWVRMCLRCVCCLDEKLVFVRRSGCIETI